MKLATVVLLGTLLPCGAFAQTVTPPPTAPGPVVTPTPGQHDHDINQRKGAQQQRIAHGVGSGQLTAGETAHLEHQERGINREEHGMRAQDNGHLTKQDRHTLHHQQNQESRRIYRDKHNGKVR